MGIAAWLELITLVLKFPSTLLAIAKLFEKTPVERHDEIVKQVDEWMKKSSEGSRPSWEHP